MEERIEYQVLAPDSVAWFIQAALVADRKGNESTRDLALAEARRIVEERSSGATSDGPLPGSIGGWMGQVERRLIELENWRQEL